MKRHPYKTDDSILSSANDSAVAYASHITEEKLIEKTSWKNALTKDELLLSIRSEMRRWDWK
ncbi:MAG: hypothetical protein LBU91_01985 [Bacteroidales bacterium]|jgi:hypothetical protein|nr:hypothetical protein [Bacteroidales bacterium]